MGELSDGVAKNSLCVKLFGINRQSWKVKIRILDSS